MGADRVSQPRWYVWAAIGAGLLLLVHRSAPWMLRGHDLPLTVSLVLLAVYVMYRLWQLSPAALMCMGLVLSVFSGNWGALGLPGFPFLPDRILIAGAIAALLLRAPGARSCPRPKVKQVHLLLALLALYALVSAASAGTLGSQKGVFDLLDRLGVVPFAMLLFAPAIFHGEREREMLLVTLVGLGAYLGLTAIFESIGPHALVVPHYIVTSDETLPGERAGGPFRSSVAEGFAIFSCGVASVIAMQRWAGRPRRHLAGLVVALSVIGCFVTLERGVWIATAAGAVAATLFLRRSRRSLAPGLLACAVLVAGALVLAPGLSQKASARVNDQRSVWDRQNQTAAALRMIAARPLFGFGWDRYVPDSLPYFRSSPDYPMTGYPTSTDPLPLHDSYLSYAVELGLVGACLWLLALFWGLGGAIFGGAADEALRPWRGALLAMTVFFLVIAFVDPLQQNFTQLLLWTWAGVAAGAARGADLPARRVFRVAPTLEGRRGVA